MKNINLSFILKITGIILIIFVISQYLISLIIQPLLDGTFKHIKSQYFSFFPILTILMQMISQFFSGLVLIALGEIISYKKK